MTALLPLLFLVICVAVAWKLFAKTTPKTNAHNTTTAKPSARTPPSDARPLFHIRYREDSGAEVQRDIFPFRSFVTPDGFEAWCYLRQDERTFRFAQIFAAHNNETRADIGVRGLRRWLGLPETEAAFLDEEPGAFKQSPWSDAPTRPRFRVTLRARRQPTAVLECAPQRWGSHRRTMGAHVWPSQEIIYFDFADVDNAVDLESGEILNCVELWRSVLSHRADEEPPWYVRLAGEFPLARAVILICREGTGRFLSKDLSHLNKSLASAGLRPITAAELTEVARNAAYHRDGNEADEAEDKQITAKDAIDLLTPAEKLACSQAIIDIAATKGAEPSRRLGLLAQQLLS